MVSWLALMALSATSQAAPSVEVSLCDISSHPERYTGRSVHTRAELIDVTPHGWFLQDSDCNAIVLFGGYTDQTTATRMMEILTPWTLRAVPGNHLYISATGTVTLGKNEGGKPVSFLAITDIDAAELTPIERHRKTRRGCGE